MLLATTGLFLRSLHHAASVPTGYQGDRVLVVTVDTNLAGLRGPQAAALADRLIERISTVTGVEAVAASRMIPLQGGGLALGGCRCRATTDRPETSCSRPTGTSSRLRSSTRSASGGWGRRFTAADREGSQFVAIVNEPLRQTPGRAATPIGQVVYQGTAPRVYDRALRVVGVAWNAKYRWIGEPPMPFIYVPIAQQPMTELNLYVRSAIGRQTAEIVRTIESVEPNLPVLATQSFAEAIGFGLLPQRLAAAASGGVGLVGLLLSALGVYGLSFHAAQRSREIAVRLALGATARQVAGLLLRQGVAVATAGSAIGLLLARGAGAGLHRLLVGVQPFDVAAFGVAAGVLGCVLWAASWAPGTPRRRQHPATILRSE